MQFQEFLPQHRFKDYVCISSYVKYIQILQFHFSFEKKSFDWHINENLYSKLTSNHQELQEELCLVVQEGEDCQGSANQAQGENGVLWQWHSFESTSFWWHSKIDSIDINLIHCFRCDLSFKWNLNEPFLGVLNSSKLKKFDIIDSNNNWRC